jgi:hypothetical protein
MITTVKATKGGRIAQAWFRRRFQADMLPKVVRRPPHAARRRTPEHELARNEDRDRLMES